MAHNLDNLRNHGRQWPLVDFVRFDVDELSDYDLSDPVAISGVPGGAVVTGGMVVVVTAFDGTTPTLNIGDADSATRYASAVDLTVTGDTALTVDGHQYAITSDILAAFSATNSTEGEAYLILEYVVEHRETEAQPWFRG